MLFEVFFGFLTYLGFQFLDMRSFNSCCLKQFLLFELFWVFNFSGFLVLGHEEFQFLLFELFWVFNFSRFLVFGHEEQEI